MLHIKETIVVEGRYDKEKLKRVTDAPIICTGGFDLYKNKGTVDAIRRMAQKTGVIILTDSDRAGFRIRSYIKQCVGSRGIVKHAYIPTVPGKERRKDKAGKEGLLGVEGISEETLAQILSRVTEVTERDAAELAADTVTAAMLYEDGFCGKDGSAEKRARLARELGLPIRITPKAMLDIINKAYGAEEYKKAAKKINLQDFDI